MHWATKCGNFPDFCEIWQLSISVVLYFDLQKIQSHFWFIVLPLLRTYAAGRHWGPSIFTRDRRKMLTFSTFRYISLFDALLSRTHALSRFRERNWIAQSQRHQNQVRKRIYFGNFSPTYCIDPSAPPIFSKISGKIFVFRGNDSVFWNKIPSNYPIGAQKTGLLLLCEQGRRYIGPKSSL